MSRCSPARGDTESLGDWSRWGRPTGQAGLADGLAGKVDGIERAEVSRLHPFGVAQDAIVDAQELDTPQHVVTSSHGLGAAGHEGPGNLCARQRAADERLTAREVASQRP